MTIKSQIAQTWQDSPHVIYRPPQVYNAATNIFNITGPVLVTLCGLWATAAAGGATTLASTWNGVAGEAAAVDIGTGTLVGEVVIIPLNVAAVIPGCLGAIPLTDALLHPKGMLVGTAPAGAVGVVIFTFAVSTWTGGIFCVYRKLAPASQMILAP
jgi:hypothetical protein